MDWPLEQMQPWKKGSSLVGVFQIMSIKGDVHLLAIIPCHTMSQIYITLLLFAC